MQRTCSTTLTALGVALIPALASAQNPPAPTPPASAETEEVAEPATSPDALDDSSADDDAAAPSTGSDEEPTPTRPAPAPPPSNDSFPTSGEVAPGFPTAKPEGADAPRFDADASPPSEPAKASGADEIFAEDWWSHARPALEIHGAFRTRLELFHKFALGRVDTPSQAIWAQPSDRRYTASNGTAYGPALCTGAETDAVASESTDATQLYSCDNNYQNSANIRLRLEPEIHVSDNLRIRSQIDLLDNLVLGSTPDGFRFSADNEGVAVEQRSGYTRLGIYDTTQLPPSSSSNSFSDSVRVKRAWGEYTTPLGELRFGRMPDHWGLGMLYNSGDGYDDDVQSTVDRLMVTTGLRALDLTFAASWDFVNEGALGSSSIPGSQPYDRASLDDVNQYSLKILYRKAPELEKLRLSRGNLVLNAGLYFVYRSQTLANDQALPGELGGAVPGANPDVQADAFARRDAQMFVPDLWFELKYAKFRFSAEAASVLGSIASTSVFPNSQESFVDSTPTQLRQYGVAAQIEQRLVEDRLRLRFDFAWASGDPDAFDDGTIGDLVPGANEVQINDDTISTFRFHPSYRVDLILNRHLLQRIQGTYLVRPSVEYDFIRDPDGQRAGGGFQVIWTRASEFVQTPGHDADLGLELNATLYFQSKDGVLNDTPETMGGFYTALQYGVLFPLDGMGYQAREEREIPGDNNPKTAQTLRLFLGVMF